jgi:hypothetical protein
LISELMAARMRNGVLNYGTLKIFVRKYSCQAYPPSPTDSSISSAVRSAGRGFAGEGFHDVKTDFMYPLIKSEVLMKRSGRSSFFRVLRRRAGGESRAFAGQTTVAMSALPIQFIRPDGYGVPVKVKQVAITLYGFGLSLKAVVSLLGSCAQPVMRWVCA